MTSRPAGEKAGMLVRLKIAIGALLILCALAISGVHAVVGQAGTGRSGEARTDFPQAPTRGDTVVAARLPIQRGERITADRLTLMRVESPLIGAPFRSIDRAAGGVARTHIAAGQILMAEDVASSEEPAGSLALLVPEGMRAVALTVNDEVAVSSFVTPSDKVDIQLVFSAEQVARLALDDGDNAILQARVLLQNVQVLSTGETLRTATDGRAIRMQTLTVAVTPRQAQLLAVAKETGAFYLALRNPADQALAALPPFSARQLAGAPAERPDKSARRTVEVIAGAASSRMAVGESR